MRRTLAGLMFGLAYTCASLAIGGWMLQRTAFNPDRTSAAVQTVLEDSAIRAEIVDIIAVAAANRLNDLGAQVTTEEIKNDPVRGINTLLEQPDTAGLMAAEFARILHDAHAHLIGERAEPVQITGQQMRDIVRDDRMTAIPTITLPVPEVGPLSFVRQLLGWLVPIMAVAAIALGIAGLTAHPDRSALLRSLGLGMLLLAVLITVFGYLLPRFAAPALNDSAWARVPARLADDAVGLVIAADAILIAGGAALLAGSGIIRRRRRWGQPVSTYRYAEQRHWS